MLEQEIMIERVRELCGQDERLVATLMYGSFAQGEGDRYSDIEFYLFFRDEVLDGIHEEAWVARLPGRALLRERVRERHRRLREPSQG